MKSEYIPDSDLLKDDLAKVERLIQSGASFEHRYYLEGDSALHRAAYGGSLDVLRFLLSEGFHIDIKNHRGDTPLMSSLGNIWAPSVECSSVLIMNGARFRLRDPGFPPLAKLLVDFSVYGKTHLGVRLADFVNGINSRLAKLSLCVVSQALITRNWTCDDLLIKKALTLRVSRGRRLIIELLATSDYAYLTESIRGGHTTDFVSAGECCVRGPFLL